MKKILLAYVGILSALLSSAQPAPHDLHFTQLATQWDEAIPLGDGILGELIWKKGDRLRFSLDRADVWDLRPMKGLGKKEFTFKWVQEQIKNNNYAIVQKDYDLLYDKEPAPSKIPTAGLEFTLPAAAVTSVNLSVSDAVCEVRWENGMIMKTFVDAAHPVGWFRFENVKSDLKPQLLAPPYEGKPSGGEINSLLGDDLSKLGYKQGPIRQEGDRISYTQEGWGGFSYDVTVEWKKTNATTVEGVWSVASHDPKKKVAGPSSAETHAAMTRGYDKDYLAHAKWWKDFWGKSTINIPDPVLEKQWYLEQYKFGSASRRGAPPISLQAVWTADNGRIPPWKGDFHHDLNTQLSYWPSYSGNHLEEALAYTDHLEQNKTNYKRFTKKYFEAEGVNVPGSTTLDGSEIGGWNPYAFSPTIGAWLSQHFYLQWRYSMDREFLKKSAYPWVKDAAIFLEGITTLDETGHRQLPISSSPEINDNAVSAWFFQNTNYDLALMIFNFRIAAELAQELNLPEEAAHWKKIESQFDDYALTKKNELMFAPSMAYNQSHRHFSNAMAIHPLSLIRYEDGPRAQSIIRNTINVMDSLGSEWWCGFSFSWMANMKARAKDGDGAAKELEIFARAFCLPNSFHVNGDQSKSGLSKFTYRPFTLEGNLAFAAGIQEMLLQSYAGFIEIMPAIPASWKDVSFRQLRAEGAFLVSAKRADGKMSEVRIVAEKGGITKLKMPFSKWRIQSQKGIDIKNTNDGFVTMNCQPAGEIVIVRENE